MRTSLGSIGLKAVKELEGLLSLGLSSEMEGILMLPEEALGNRMLPSWRSLWQKATALLLLAINGL